MVFDRIDVRILAFAGSAREGSLNKKLVKIAAVGASNAGAIVTVIDLKDYPLPLYDADLESKEGMPQPARDLKKLMAERDGFLIATPEYNSAMTPLLKNMIDWCSRSASEDERPLNSWRGKVVGLMSASPGGLGGLRGLMMTRDVLSNLGLLILPEQRAVPQADRAFDDHGQLNDASLQKSIEQIGARTAGLIRRMKMKI
jgi:chromate reductase, NAD(P)H dehydrogenase (quinone)